MGSEVGNVVESLAELQLLATRVQYQKRSLISLDERRQKLREAEGMLRKSKIQGPDSWVCLGPTTFLQLPTKTAADFLAKDRKIVDDTIVETERELKRQMDELLKKEGSKSLSDRGFDLIPPGEKSNQD